MKHAWLKAAAYAGITPSSGQVDRMKRYGEWLEKEALSAGGIGPGEVGRIDRRHLADSVLFLSQIPAFAGEIWDLGTGVGLPGIPMAICRPETKFLLVDRSGRRVDLLRRVIRILDLHNCQIWQGDISDLTGSTETIVSRASIPPSDLGEVATRLLLPGGRAVVGGSWRRRPQVDGWSTIEIPQDALDQTVWLLMMRRE